MFFIRSEETSIFILIVSIIAIIASAFHCYNVYKTPTYQAIVNDLGALTKEKRTDFGDDETYTVYIEECFVEIPEAQVDGYIKITVERRYALQLPKINDTLTVYQSSNGVWKETSENGLDVAMAVLAAGIIIAICQIVRLRVFYR